MSDKVNESAARDPYYGLTAPCPECGYDHPSNQGVGAAECIKSVAAAIHDLWMAESNGYVTHQLRAAYERLQQAEREARRGSE